MPLRHYIDTTQYIVVKSLKKVILEAAANRFLLTLSEVVEPKHRRNLNRIRSGFF
jgi:hypothetical protein